MQSVLASSTSIVRPVVATRSTGRVTASRVVVCRAQQQPKQSPVRKAAAAAVALPALLAAHPAFALVRMLLTKFPCDIQWGSAM